MTSPVDPAVFVREVLGEFLESQLVNGFISTSVYQDHLATLRRYTKLPVLSRRLFKISPGPVLIEGFGLLRIVYLREPDGTEFPFLQGFAENDSLTRREKCVCFVGHRFLSGIEKSLRFNLIHLFEPHRIKLRWSGYDLSASDIFQDVVSGIRNADLCLFDNLGTLNRPNVYIEVGIAYALEKPMLVCEYAGTGKNKVPDTESVPADLQGLIRIQYKSYQDLCKRLYFGLPRFLERHELI